MTCGWRRGLDSGRLARSIDPRPQTVAGDRAALTRDPSPSAAAATGDDRPPDRADCYTIRYPRSHPAPLVLSSPHSGCVYTPEFVGLSRLSLPGLRRSEDCFIDELFGSGPDFGATLIAASFPRAWCDANREAWELDPSMFDDKLPDWVNTTSPRVAAGLGTIARVVSNGEAIYRGSLRFADAQARVAACWQPYHDALTQLLAAARARHGACLLVDCHSMPAHACRDRRPVPDIVLGDAHGTACAPAVLRRVESFLVQRRYVVRRNDPYAGGYITRHYGRPSADCHALQIEVARGLYMDEANLTKSSGFGRVEADLRALAEMLSEELPALLERDRGWSGGDAA